jgi:hypothetical protein
LGEDAGVAHSARTLAFLLAVGVAAPAALAGPGPLNPPRDQLFYGHIASLKPSGKRYLMRFDPAVWLTGKAASDYAFERFGSRDVPNDYIVYDPDHRLFSYLVGAGAKVTVVTNRSGITGSPVNVAQLARIVAGKRVPGVVPFEPKAGFWVLLRGDAVVWLRQQYQP